MKETVNKSKVIIELHERGFTEDFQLAGSDIFWVQQRLLLSLKEIVLIEFHRFIDSGNYMTIFGVISYEHCVQGILITRPKKTIIKDSFNRQNQEALSYQLMD